MKAIVLDYSGHLPQADLSKKLSTKSVNVLHLYCTDYITGNANFSFTPKENQLIEFRGVSADIVFDKYNFSKRLRHEKKIANKFFQIIREFDPDIIVLSNLPLLAALILTKKLKFAKIPYVYWWQDVYATAIVTELIARFNQKGLSLPSKIIYSMERSTLKHAKAVVAISENFKKQYHDWNLDPRKLFIQPNWSAPEDFIDGPVRTSPLSEPYIIYAGTLGLKHNPQLLIELADMIAQQDSVTKLVVVSQGLGRDFLSSPENLRDNVILKDFLPFDELKNHLFHALAVIAILEPSASEYSVPSKVMTYFCAGKAIIAALGPENQVARYIRDSNSGYVVSTESANEMAAAALELISDESLRKQMEKNSRKFAIENFSGNKAADLFIQLFNQ